MPITDENLDFVDAGFDGRLFIKAGGKKAYITLPMAYGLGKLLINLSEDPHVQAVDEYLPQLKIMEKNRRHGCKQFRIMKTNGE